MVCCCCCSLEFFFCTTAIHHSTLPQLYHRSPSPLCSTNDNIPPTSPPIVPSERLVVRCLRKTVLPDFFPPRFSLPSMTASYPAFFTRLASPLLSCKQFSSVIQRMHSPVNTFPQCKIELGSGGRCDHFLSFIAPYSLHNRSFPRTHCMTTAMISLELHRIVEIFAFLLPLVPLPPPPTDSTITQPTSWWTESPSTWVCGIQLVKKITIGFAHSPTPRPTSSSYVSPW